MRTKVHADGGREIVVEVERTEFVRKSARTTKLFCPTCLRENDFVRYRQLAELFEVGENAGDELTDMGKRHAVVFDEASFICVSAIFERLNSSEKPPRARKCGLLPGVPETV